MFGNTPLSFEDNKSLEDVCINQENFDLNQIRVSISDIKSCDYFTHSSPFPINVCSVNQWQHNNPVPDKSFN